METDTNTEEMSAEMLQNKNPDFLIELYEEALSFLINYGWYCLIALIVLLYIFTKLQPFINHYLKEKEEREYEAKYHKNSDLHCDRLLAMEKSRERMQEKLNRAAAEHNENLKLKEEQRRQLILQQTEGLDGHRLGNGKKSFKPDYNPLVGSGGQTYRAPKRSACGGGGCGKK